MIVLGGFFGYRYLTQARQIESIAEMPFKNVSGNPDVEYLSDGLTESLINSLSTLPNLSVKARNTVFRYKGKEIDEKKVGQELSVQAVLFARFIQRGERPDLVSLTRRVRNWKRTFVTDSTQSRASLDSLRDDCALSARQSQKDTQKNGSTWPTPALNGSFSSDFGYTTGVHPLLHETLP